MHYAKMAAAGYKGGLVTAPAVGDFCCAKFIQDDTWYRVLVTSVEESEKGVNNNTAVYNPGHFDITDPTSTSMQHVHVCHI